MFAGELIFSLPFQVPRFFRPTLLQVFGLSNAALGDIFAVYGITAMLAYFPGGVIADRYSPRKLMALSLMATAMGGVYLAQIPSQAGLYVLYGYWGITSILLFWAALLRATRQWGGSLAQGRAFGFLDGGRGLVAAGLASLGVWVFSQFLPEVVETASASQQKQALQSIGYFYSIATALVALLVWKIIPDDQGLRHRSVSNPWSGVALVIKRSDVWLQSVIVVCAYCGYKGLDYYGLYAVDILGMNELASSQFTANLAYLRPVGAIAAGFLADQFLGSRVIGVGFSLLALVYFVLSLLQLSDSNLLAANLIYANVMVSFVAVYAIRGVYFALFEESKMDRSHTGTAIGLISVVGFTPDIFFSSITGRILDASPGFTGYQHYFWFMTATGILGMLVTLLLMLRIRRSSANNPLSTISRNNPRESKLRSDGDISLG